MGAESYDGDLHEDIGATLLHMYIGQIVTLNDGSLLDDITVEMIGPDQWNVDGVVLSGIEAAAQYIEGLLS